MKLWGGRFNKPTDQLVDEFTASIHFDHHLAQVDIQGSIVHAKMLKQCDVLSEQEQQQIEAGLTTILQRIEQGQVEFRVSDEDIHMNVERLLHEEIGALAGKLHTGRSRNDQVATDLHLYLREQVNALIEKLNKVQQALFDQAEQHVDTILPGYTHLQRAQPVRLAHHLLAYFWMLQRDVERLQDSLKRINSCPLGAGALAGAGFEFDRAWVAQQLGFDTVYENSLDAVSDRDFVVEFLSHASLIMMHLSRLSEELVLWASKEFSFIELDDAYCTGSSMMPQKKNPDVPELVRGKTGRVYGALMGILTVLKGLPLAYNKDMQEDKEGVFDVLTTLHGSLDLFAPMLATMKVNQTNMRQAVTQDFSNATELADYLVKKGMPFREAHAVTGQLVMQCIGEQQLLIDLPLEALQQHSDLFEQDIYGALAPEHAIEARAVRGGTAKAAVLKQLQQAKRYL